MSSFWVALLPEPAFARVLCFGEARDALALLLTGTDGAGRAFFRLERGAELEPHVCYVFLPQETPPLVQLIGIPQTDSDEDEGLLLDLPRLELNPVWPGGYLHTRTHR